MDEDGAVSGAVCDDQEGRVDRNARTNKGSL